MASASSGISWYAATLAKVRKPARKASREVRSAKGPAHLEQNGAVQIKRVCLVRGARKKRSKAREGKRGRESKGARAREEERVPGASHPSS